MKFFWSYIFISLGALHSQNIVEENGKFYEDGRLFTGKIVEYRDNIIRKEILITKGQIHKNIRFYHSNAQLQEQGAYKRGKKDGLWEVWNKDGQKISEAWYFKGKKDNTWIIWDDNGVKRCEMHYDKGKKVGVWKRWGDKSDLISQKSYES